MILAQLFDQLIKIWSFLFSLMKNTRCQQSKQ
jgi:hypothetical protein